MFTLAVFFGWSIQHLYINAFLNEDLHENVFMMQPKGYVDQQRQTFVSKLQKALYGLRQALRVWFQKLMSALLSWGFQNSVSDISLFFCNKKNSMVLLLVYDDDILITGENSTLIQQVIIDLNKHFALKTLGEVNYFLGFEAFRNSTGLY